MHMFGKPFRAAIICCLFACSQPDTGPDKGNSKNYLSMKIDGKEWSADFNVSGGYHVTEALGPGILSISGQKGKGSTQQDFVINLYRTDGAGTYLVNIADGSTQAVYQNAAQFANLTPSNYLCGGAMQGSQLKVVITKASKSTQELEGTFSGTMQCVEGNKIVITEGKFYYRE